MFIYYFVKNLVGKILILKIILLLQGCKAQLNFATTQITLDQSRISVELCPKQYDAKTVNNNDQVYNLQFCVCAEAWNALVKVKISCNFLEKYFYKQLAMNFFLNTSFHSAIWLVCILPYFFFLNHISESLLLVECGDIIYGCLYVQGKDGKV